KESLSQLNTVDKKQLELLEVMLPHTRELIKAQLTYLTYLFSQLDHLEEQSRQCKLTEEVEEFRDKLRQKTKDLESSLEEQRKQWMESHTQYVDLRSDPAKRKEEEKKREEQSQKIEGPESLLREQKEKKVDQLAAWQNERRQRIFERRLSEVAIASIKRATNLGSELRSNEIKRLFMQIEANAVDLLDQDFNLSLKYLLLTERLNDAKKCQGTAEEQ